MEAYAPLIISQMFQLVLWKNLSCDLLHPWNSGTVPSALPGGPCLRLYQWYKSPPGVASPGAMLVQRIRAMDPPRLFEAVATAARSMLGMFNDVLG